jgi:predicted CopG family antitoxin
MILPDKKLRSTEVKKHKTVIVNMNLYNELNSIKKRNNFRSISDVISTLLGLAKFDAELKRLLRGDNVSNAT